MWVIYWKFLSVLSVINGFQFSNFDFETILQNLTTSYDFASLTQNCQNEILKFYTALNSEIWPFQMIDSITKIPDGIFYGHNQIPGHYDECLEIPDDFAKHCMVNLTLKFTESENTNYLTYLKKALNNRSNVNKLSFLYGLCLPKGCTADDINLFPQILGKEEIITINADENYCSGSKVIRTEDWITIAFLSALGIIVIASTAYDYNQTKVKKNEKPSQIFSAFSVIKNGEILFKISHSSKQLKCLYGIRFLSMCWVVFGHSYFTIALGGPINLVNMHRLLADKTFLPISNAFVSVDTFFFLSGLLVCIVFFRDISKKGSFDVPVAFIHRYLRLTPPFAILILIQSTIVTHLGDGPFWNTRITPVENACRESWWTDVLYVQNLLKPTEMCLGQSWYLSADMQMFWLSPLILYPMLFFPVFAPILVLILILLAASLNFAIAFTKELQPSFSVNFGPNTLRQFEHEYAPFYTRMAPWLIGLGTGYIICGLQAKKISFRLSRSSALLGWLISLLLLGGSFFGLMRFVDNSNFTQVESSLYLALHRVGWALGLSWLTVACVSGYGGLINKFLSLDIFQPLAKLTYCTFLIHMTMQNFHIGTARVNPYLRNFDAVYSFFGDIVISNLVAIPATLILELPFTHIDRHFFQKLVIFPFPDRKNKPGKVADDRKEKINENKEKIDKMDKMEKAEEENNGKINAAFTEF